MGNDPKTQSFGDQPSMMDEQFVKAESLIGDLFGDKQENQQIHKLAETLINSLKTQIQTEQIIVSKSKDRDQIE